jgi:hypothetical protein
VGARNRHKSTLHHHVRHIRDFANADTNAYADSNAHSDFEQQWP